MWLASEEKKLTRCNFHRYPQTLPFTIHISFNEKYKKERKGREGGRLGFFLSMLFQKLLKLQYNKCWKTERLRRFQFGRSTKSCGWTSNLFHSSLAIKRNLCTTAAKVHHRMRHLYHSFLLA